MTRQKLALVAHQDSPVSGDRIDNLTVIASGKGGVGKTWFSIHLAHALGLSKQHVLLIDGDFGLANVDVQLGLMPVNDLSTVLSGHCGVDACLIGDGPGAFDLLPGHSGASGLATLSPCKTALFKSLLVTLSTRYDHIILDLGAGIGPLVTSFVPMAAQVTVVITAEPTSLTDAYVLIKVMKKHFPHVPLQVVTNQVESVAEGKKVFNTLAQACEKFLGFRLHNLGFLPKEPAVPRAIRAQKLLPHVAPDSMAWRKVQEMSRVLFQHKIAYVPRHSFSL